MSLELFPAGALALKLPVHFPGGVPSTGGMEAAAMQNHTA